MDNVAVAAVFAEMGDLLAIQGGDPHRARAFRNTARIIEEQHTPVSELLQRGLLQKVPGIGAGSVERVQQILTTGTCPDHQRLLQRLPTGLRPLLQVRGMGARNVRLVFERLGITTVEQLEWAARNGLLAQVEGIGQRTVQRVLNHLEQRRQGDAPRVLLSEALRLGALLVDWMRDDPSVLRVEQTGSARRRRETVGDLDVLVATMHPRRASERFLAFPDIRETLLEGTGRASIILDNGLQADLRTVTPENWGAGLHYFTGSKAHNIKLRVRANARKLSVSEHGIYERRIKGRGHGEENRKIAPRLTAGTEEADVFRVLDLPFIVPELRQGDGEIEAAAQGKLPLLVDDTDLVADTHLRAANLKTAVAQVQQLQHARPLSWLCWLRPLDTILDDEARLRFRHDAQKLSERCGLRVFAGTELSAGLDGSLALPDVVRAELDVVVVECALPPNTLPKGEATARVLSVVASGLVDGLSHLTGRELLVHDGNELDVRVVLMACARQKVFVEVGGEPERLDLDHKSCRVARDLGTMLSITARATDVPELDRRRFAVWQARRGWISPLTVLNAWPVVEAERFFGRGGRVPLPALSADEDDDGALAVPELLTLPLTADVRARVEAFLVGADDDELRLALERRGGNALSAAFALLATDDANT